MSFSKLARSRQLFALIFFRYYKFDQAIASGEKTEGCICILVNNETKSGGGDGGGIKIC